MNNNTLSFSKLNLNNFREIYITILINKFLIKKNISIKLIKNITLILFKSIEYIYVKNNLR